VSQFPIILATRSEGKLAELRPLFAAAGFNVVDLAHVGIEEDDDEQDLEQFDTFEENALAKARYFYETSGGITTVADDSGLEVRALGGRPGVRSKRWSGRADVSGRALDEANNAKLLHDLAPHADRSARYVCVAAYVGLGRELTARGECAGRIVAAARGTNGFGYDPYFESAETGRTFGEMTREEKEGLSHRGRAFRALFAELRSGR
jgi:XTP/dITP diphosphohydrolase